MRQITFLLVVSACCFNCSTKKETIDFIHLSQNEFNSTRFQLPTDNIPASAKKTHDSCMGFSFEANAILIQTKDTFFIGSVVNRQSLKVIGSVNDLGLNQPQLFGQFNIIGAPCYEKTALHFPLRSIFGEDFAVQIPGADGATNKEINELLQASTIDEIESGPWVYLDMKDLLKNILDSIRSEPGLRYKSNALDSANMLLTTVEAITYLTFVIHTKTEISPSLQAALKSEPFAPFPKANFTVQLFYVNNRQMKISANGFFPAAGEFMRVVTR